ncbi:MAG: DUF2062 domain-containing protein [Comamonadaceae bacterium]|nr:DUF2062 domain-containing protein [Comamonadaceae bacterium]
MRQVQRRQFACHRRRRLAIARWRRPSVRRRRARRTRARNRYRPGRTIVACEGFRGRAAGHCSRRRGRARRARGTRGRQRRRKAVRETCAACAGAPRLPLTGAPWNPERTMRRFRDWAPRPEAIRENRWLRWLGPALHHPRLWHMSRRGLALGMALGFFFGLLIPLAQIPLSAAAAVALRANVPAAVASTLVTNPLTFGPLYYTAWRIGSAILGDPDEPPPQAEDDLPDQQPDESAWSAAVRRIAGVGKPLLVGLAVMASVVGLSTYVVVSTAWKLVVLWKWRRRHLLIVRPFSATSAAGRSSSRASSA